MQTLKLTQIGNSVGLVLPRNVSARLRVEKGDSLFISESPDGLRLVRTDPEFLTQMKAARDVMKKRRAVLYELAKSRAATGCAKTFFTPSTTLNCWNTAGSRVFVMPDCLPQRSHGHKR